MIPSPLLHAAPCHPRHVRDPHHPGPGIQPHHRTWILTSPFSPQRVADCGKEGGALAAPRISLCTIELPTCFFPLFSAAHLISDARTSLLTSPPSPPLRKKINPREIPGAGTPLLEERSSRSHHHPPAPPKLVRAFQKGVKATFAPPRPVHVSVRHSRQGAWMGGGRAPAVSKGPRAGGEWALGDRECSRGGRNGYCVSMKGGESGRG